MKLGNIRFSVGGGNGQDPFDDFVDDLEDDIDEAFQEAMPKIASEGRQAAQQRIRLKDRIWNRDVLHNWIPIRERTEFGVTVTGFQNYSVHAAAVDEGATYDDGPPNFGNIKSYVLSEGLHAPGEADQAAYALMKHIEENGLRGINFTGEAEKRMEEVGPEILAEELGD